MTSKNYLLLKAVRVANVSPSCVKKRPVLHRTEKPERKEENVKVYRPRTDAQRMAERAKAKQEQEKEGNKNENWIYDREICTIT